MFKLPDLPYKYNALEPYIDEKTMRIHHDKHHAGYVNNLNEVLKDHKKLLKKDIKELIKDADRLPNEIIISVRNNGGGHLNHSLYWQIMTPNSTKKPIGEVSKIINSQFGSFANFKIQFTDAALKRFGSGWAWLSLNKNKILISSTANQDNPLSDVMNPLLAIDVWEHAYYLKYQNQRAEYIKAWWNVVNWAEVEKNFNNIAK